MPKLLQYEATRYASFGVLSASSQGTLVTASGTPLAKGAWAQLLASTLFDAAGFWVAIAPTNTNTAYNIDIGIGGSGSETVIVADLIAMVNSGSTMIRPNYFIPIGIPAGSRLVARCAAQNASNTCRISGQLYGAGLHSPPTFSLMTAYGLDATDLQGVQIDPGGTINTKGAYSEITSGTARDHRAIMMVQTGQNNTAQVDHRHVIDVAIGASSSETIVIPDLQATVAAGEDMPVPMIYPLFPLNIPAGTRLSVRAQADINDATDRLFDVLIYGLS